MFVSVKLFIENKDPNSEKELEFLYDVHINIAQVESILPRGEDKEHSILRLVHGDKIIVTDTESVNRLLAASNS